MTPQQRTTHDGRSTLPGLGGLRNRRDWLRLGGLSLAACLLPGLRAAGTGKSRSVICLWMAGGVTHIDGLDPKPDAPDEVRGPLRAIPTNVPGIQFCETLPQLAQVADRLAVLRSFTSESDDHFLSQAYALSGRKVKATELTSEPNVGAIVSHVQGPRNGLPAYLAVPGTLRTGGTHDLFVGGWLGEQHAPFAIGGPPVASRQAMGVATRAQKVDIEADLRLEALRPPEGVEPARLLERRRLREQLEQAARSAEDRRLPDLMDQHYRSAFDLLTSPRIREALDLGREPAGLKERYGHTKLGRRCLLARRCVEAGARFVLVDYGYDRDYGNLWDTHCAGGQDQTPIVEVVKRPHHLAGLDRAAAALIADLAERGRLDETLVVFLTEFGRTPRINKDGGRDHWGKAGALFFAGGGIQGGQVIGGTNRDGGLPTGRNYTPGDVAATIFQAIGIDPHAMIRDRESRPLPAVPKGEVIPGIF